MRKVIKKDISDAVYENFCNEVSNESLVYKLLNCVLDEITNQLKKPGECNIEFRGFGTFHKKMMKAKLKARNPKTGETIQIPAHYHVTFQGGKELKFK